MATESVSPIAPSEHGTAVSSANAPTRFVELDALRGVAAMMVVLMHFSSFTAEDHKPHSMVMLLMRPVIAGHQAVIVFFLLSGFVLSLSTWKESLLPYKDYLIRRVFRIYVPYLGALFLAVAACAVLYNHARVTPPWGALDTWNQPPTLASVLQHIAFLGDYDVVKYNRPFWTLVIEMRVSIVFPFVCVALGKVNTWIGALSAVALSLGATVLTVRNMGGSTWYSTLHYLAFFMVGALLARRLNGRPWPAIPRALRHAMVPVSILLFAYSPVLSRHLTSIPPVAAQYMLEWPTALGGLGFIYLAATHRSVQRTLGHYIPRFLGHISYSLYLIHNLVLMVLMTMLYGRISMVLLFLIYLVLAIGFSFLFNRYVEMPAMQLGRRLTQARRPSHA